MGFHSLTSSALASGPFAGKTDHNDISDSMTTVQGHTDSKVPHDVEKQKLGTPTSGSSLSDSDVSDLNKVDNTAEAGVQAVQAATHVWTKRDLILAYALYAISQPSNERSS